MSEQRRIAVARDGYQTCLTLARPEKLNALDPPMITEIMEALAAVRADQTCRVLVLVAEGRAFCVGVDLHALQRQGTGDSGDSAISIATLFRTIRQMPVPTIAAVQGYALGAGAALALSCDIVVAMKDSTFGFPEVERGLVPAVAMVGLESLIGRRRIVELILLAQQLTGADAFAQNLITTVVDTRPEMHARVAAYAGRITAMSPTAERLIKRFMLESEHVPYDEALEAAEVVVALGRTTNDAKEGALAFSEHRAPVWTGE